MPIRYAKISMLTENHMERNLSKIKTIIISQDPGGNDNENYTDDIPLDGKTIKCSTTDPESGWFRKENTSMCLHMGLSACDKNGWIIDFTVNPGNEHDSRTLKGFMAACYMSE